MDEKREFGDPESEFLASRASRAKEQHQFLGGTGERGNGKNDRGDDCPDENNRKRVDEFWTEFNEQKALCSKAIAEMKEGARKCGEGSLTTCDKARNNAKLVSFGVFVFVLWPFCHHGAFSYSVCVLIATLICCSSSIALHFLFLSHYAMRLYFNGIGLFVPLFFLLLLPLMIQSTTTTCDQCIPDI